MVELTTLESTNLSLLTEAWNRCWQGYFYEMFFSEENLRIWIEHGKVELKHSMALKDQGKIVGFTFLSQANLEGWIAGTAIDPHYRGRRLFAPLLQAQIDLARSLGLGRIYLEVLSQNYARRTYQNLGFKYIRDLHLYRLTPGVLNLAHARSLYTNFHSVEPSAYFLARRKAGFIPSWQRRAQYLKRYTSISAWLTPYETAGMLYGGAEGKTLLDAWAAFDDSAQELLSILNERNSGEFSLTNQPQDPITRILTFAGICPTALLYEMTCEINKTR